MRPTATVSPTATRQPTWTPTHPGTSALVPIRCPARYNRHLDTRYGFSACYPVGWLKDDETDYEKGTVWQFFISPLPPDGTPEEQKRIAVCIIPGIRGSDTGFEADEYVEAVTEWLNETKQRPLIQPRLILVGGYEAVEVSYEGSDVFGGELVKLTGLSVFLGTDDRMFFIEVAGASEHSEEVARIYREFIAHFVLLPIE